MIKLIFNKHVLNSYALWIYEITKKNNRVENSSDSSIMFLMREKMMQPD